MITSLFVDRLDGRGPLPAKVSSKTNVITKNSIIVISGVYTGTIEIDSDDNHILDESIDIETKQNGTTKTFKAFIPSDPRIKRNFYLTSFDVTAPEETHTVEFSTLTKKPESFHPLCSISIEDDQIVAYVEKDKATHIKITLTENFFGYHETQEFKYSLSLDTSRFVLKPIKKSLIKANVQIEFWSLEGTRRSTNLTIHNNEISNLQRYIDPVEYSYFTQKILNKFPLWAACRNKDTFEMVRSQSVPSKTLQEAVIWDDISPEPNLQKLVNGLAGSSILEYKNVTNLKVAKELLTTYPLFDPYQFFSVPLKTRSSKISLSMYEGFSNLYNMVQGNFSFIIDQGSKAIITLSNGKTINLSEKSGIVTIKNSEIEYQFEPNNNYIFVNVDNGTVSVNTEITFNIGTLTLTKLNTMNISGFKGSSTSRTGIVTDRNQTCIPVATVAELERAPTSSLVKSNHIPTNLDFIYQTKKGSCEGKRVIMDKNGDFHTVRLVVNNSTIKMEEVQNRDIIMEFGLLINSNGWTCPISDICSGPYFSYALTDGKIIEFSQDTPAPLFPSSYLMAVSIMDSPHENATRVSCDKSGRLWLS